jgi:ABC-2 type transport system permease protein
VALEVVKNPSQAFLPQVVEEGVSLGAVVLSQASVAFRPELETVQALFSEEGAPPSADVAALAAGINDRFAQVERYVLPPVLTLESSTAKREPEEEGAAGSWSGGSVSILSVFLPGLSVMGILFLAQAATRDILRERESGLLRHLLAAPVSVTDYLVGKCLSVLLVTALGFGVLVVVGLALGVTWGPPLAVAVLVLATSIGAAGTLLLLMSLVRTERQGDALTTIVIIVWSMVGGVFLPVSQIPGFLLPISKSSLTYWASEGFLDLILHSGGLADVLPNVLVLTGIGVLFVAVGVWRLHRTIAAGVR